MAELDEGLIARMRAAGWIDHDPDKGVDLDTKREAVRVAMHSLVLKTGEHFPFEIGVILHEGRPGHVRVPLCFLCARPVELPEDNGYSIQLSNELPPGVTNTSIRFEMQFPWNCPCLSKDVRTYCLWICLATKFFVESRVVSDAPAANAALVKAILKYGGGGEYTPVIRERLGGIVHIPEIAEALDTIEAECNMKPGKIKCSG